MMVQERFEESVILPNLNHYGAKVVAVAPMLAWTDRHCRYFHRLLSRRALLYTEMVVADAVIHGNRQRLLGFNVNEHPLALQLGGADPAKLAEAARIGEGFGYDEINLNVGCPSDRVQSGVFGACLMKTPDLVAECVAAMRKAVSVPVTVKCRIGVDDQDIEQALDRLSDAVFAAGGNALWVHARKAWLQGLSPKENRDIPPLDHDRVYRLKARLKGQFIGINGGISSLEEAQHHLEQGIDGVMLGRIAYHEPALLSEVDTRFYGEPAQAPVWDNIIAEMEAYVAHHVEAGGRLSHVTRHMTGLFHGLPGARRWRQVLSTDATAVNAGHEVLRSAFSHIRVDEHQAA